MDTLPTHFWDKVLQLGPTSCWLWTAATRRGYGRFKWHGRLQEAHRVAYEVLRGGIPTYLECDHLCRVRSCVNPHHLELVTRSENIRRGDGGKRFTHCRKGHSLTEENTIIQANGDHRCRICRNTSNRACWQRKQLAYAP